MKKGYSFFRILSTPLYSRFIVLYFFSTYNQILLLQYIRRTFLNLMSFWPKYPLYSFKLVSTPIIISLILVLQLILISTNAITNTYYSAFITFPYTSKSQCYLTPFLNSLYIRFIITLKSLTQILKQLYSPRNPFAFFMFLGVF